jgi:septal ring factor EnvC (AmiA/AmiB activator)
METDELSEQEKDDQAYQDLLAQKARLEEELQFIMDELQPLKMQLEALDKSIAQDEAELPILEAAMMQEVREFLGKLCSG